MNPTPFAIVDTLDSEEKAIRHSVWRRFTESKVVEELLTKPEFPHVLEEMKAGLSCSLNGSPKNNIYRISSEGRGIKLDVNRKFAESLGEHQVHFFQGVVEAGIEGYGSLFMQLKGLLTRPSADIKDFEVLAQTKKER